jgi:hypothetical protein
MNGPLSQTGGSQLLMFLWYQKPVPVYLGNNPVGAGTWTDLVNVVETISIDPAV